MSYPLPKIGKLATNALNHINITTLEEVAKLDEKTLLKLHGVGPKAVRLLKEHLSEKGLQFANRISLPFSPKFAVIGDLKCDNAPKQRIIRDFLVARAANKKNILNKLLEEKGACHIVNGAKTYNRNHFYEKISQMQNKISSLTIQTNLSHGKEGASQTTLTLTNGEKIYIADFYLFASHKKGAKIQSVTTYMVNEPFF